MALLRTLLRTGEPAVGILSSIFDQKSWRERDWVLTLQTMSTLFNC